MTKAQRDAIAAMTELTSEPRYSEMDMNDRHEIDMIRSSLVALVDEQAGGIVGYIISDFAGEIVTRLNTGHGQLKDPSKVRVDEDNVRFIEGKG